MTTPTRYEAAGGVATITLDMPERRNALGHFMVRSFLDHMEQALADESVRCVVLANSGTTFSAGADLKQDRSQIEGVPLGFPDMVRAIVASPKPVIARVAGHCAGGGAALVCMCDIAIASDTSRIGITEVRIGIPPSGVAAMILHRMTTRHALEAFLTGEMVPAARAVEMGLINQAVPEEQLDAEVTRVVEGILRGGPASLAATKQLVLEFAGIDLEHAIARGEELGKGAFDSAEAREGVAAFRERRDPSWIPPG
ncbi:MAG: enoyl-CoA hydratase/isomerase family protein [Acidimicrobiales bacterium]